jgi:hypothetical protein
MNCSFGFMESHFSNEATTPRNIEGMANRLREQLRVQGRREPKPVKSPWKVDTLEEQACRLQTLT